MKNAEKKYILHIKKLHQVFTVFLLLTYMFGFNMCSGTDSESQSDQSDADTDTTPLNLKEPTLTIISMYKMSEGSKVHSTTRGTIDLVHRYQGVWFVFHAASQDPCCSNTGFQTSLDGVTWSPLKTGDNSAIDQLSRSYLIEDNRITKIYPFDSDPDPEIWNPELYICDGIITGEDITWNNPQLVMPADSINSWYYYNSLKRDASGRLNFTGRHWDGTITDIFWIRAENPFDHSSWENPFMVVEGDNNIGVDAHKNIQLDGNEVYVLSRTNTVDTYVPGYPQKFYGRHFDGTTWEAAPTELGISDGICGSDRRLDALLDPNTDVIHFLYIDNNRNLFHRTLSAPYNSSDWTDPVLIETNVFTCTMGIDTNVSPSRLALVYGDQIESDGGRLHTGDLYLKWFNGLNWESNSILISEPGTTYNWYPNIIRDVSGDIGIMYLKGHWQASSLDIMFSLLQYD